MEKIFPRLSKEAQSAYKISQQEKVYKMCGTGHRPSRLGLGFDGASASFLKKFVVNQLEYIQFPLDGILISGGALGWDMAIAEAAVEMGLRLWLALPFEGFGSNWNKTQQQSFSLLKSKSEKIIIVCDGEFSNNKYFYRDVFMVECCNEILANFDGKKHGGTYWTLEYAKEREKPVYNTYSSYQLYFNKDGVK